ncbi:helix-turn-helix domain-containing protein [Chryseobacterium sp. c4a]|uniref:helix-turn-helix domain-containing protein n=1 Tax=Chryseobacterium sp. c4a TaxID=1573582 RepID=UPI0013598500|nr:helix-turn-helix domain-containing protein [Chryseobacterium sp. c4a]
MMNTVKELTLQYLNNDFKNLELQKGYIFVPDFIITPDLMEPYRSNYYCLGYIESGTVILQSNLTEYEINAPAILFADPTAIKNWRSPGENFKAKSVLISEDFLQHKYIESQITSVFSNLSESGTFVNPLTKKESGHCKELLKIIDDYTPPQSSFQTEIIQGVVYTFLNLLADLYEKQGKAANIISTLSLRFRKAVTENAVKTREVNFYASYLKVHPKYLTNVVRSETGRPASFWIHQQVVLESKLLLQNETLTLAQIAEMLNFPDQSTFGKYFKRYSTMSPNQYREQLKQLS